MWWQCVKLPPAPVHHALRRMHFTRHCWHTTKARQPPPDELHQQMLIWEPCIQVWFSCRDCEGCQMPSQPQQLHAQALKGLHVLALAGHAPNILRQMRRRWTAACPICNKRHRHVRQCNRRLPHQSERKFGRARDAIDSSNFCSLARLASLTYSAAGSSCVPRCPASICCPATNGFVYAHKYGGS
jgi:hypothetical protein